MERSVVQKPHYDDMQDQARMARERTRQGNLFGENDTDVVHDSVAVLGGTYRD